MEHTLRIREVTTNGEPAIYNDVDIGHGNSITRIVSKPAMIKDLANVRKEKVSIHFVADTYHNRAKFLQIKNCEVSIFENGNWVCIPRSWLDIAFADAIPVVAEKKSDTPAPPPKNDPPIVINSISDFEKIPRNMQKRHLVDLLRSGLPTENIQHFLNEIVNATSNLIPHTVKDFAGHSLKELNKK